MVPGPVPVPVCSLRGNGERQNNAVLYRIEPVPGSDPGSARPAPATDMRRCDDPGIHSPCPRQYNLRSTTSAILLTWRLNLIASTSSGPGPDIRPLQLGNLQRLHYAMSFIFLYKLKRANIALERLHFGPSTPRRPPRRRLPGPVAKPLTCRTCPWQKCRRNPATGCPTPHC